MAFFSPHDRDRSVYGIKKSPFSQLYESLITLCSPSATMRQI